MWNGASKGWQFTLTFVVHIHRERLCEGLTVLTMSCSDQWQLILPFITECQLSTPPSRAQVIQVETSRWMHIARDGFISYFIQITPVLKPACHSKVFEKQFSLSLSDFRSLWNKMVCLLELLLLCFITKACIWKDVYYVKIERNRQRMEKERDSK